MERACSSTKLPGRAMLENVHKRFLSFHITLVRPREAIITTTLKIVEVVACRVGEGTQSGGVVNKVMVSYGDNMMKRKTLNTHTC